MINLSKFMKNMSITELENMPNKGIQVISKEFYDHNMMIKKQQEEREKQEQEEAKKAGVANRRQTVTPANVVDNDAEDIQDVFDALEEGDI